MSRPGWGRLFDARSAAAERGSLFVESMIAAAIASLMLTAAWRVVADGAARERGLEGRRTALLVAQSQLAAVGAAIPLRAGDSDGSDGKVTWRVAVSPYDDAIESSSAGQLWRVEVLASAPDGQARLETLRLGPAAR